MIINKGVIMKLKNLLLFGLIFLFIASCGKKEEEVIRIGAVLPLTGDIASYGISTKNGIELGLSIINANDSNKYKIEINYQNSKGETQTAVNIMHDFCSIKKYPVVIGEAASSVSLAMIPIANMFNVLQISSVSSSPELSLDDYFFRVCPSDAFQANISAKWIYNDGYKKVGIIYVKNSWGESLKNEFKNEFENLGGEVLIEEASNEGDKNFRTIITKILNSKVDAIYCPTYGIEGGIILKQLKEMGNKLPIYGADVWSSPELILTAGNSSNGVMLVKPDKFENSKYINFRKDYLSKYNIEPDVYAAYSFDLIMILSNAFEEGILTGELLKNYMLNMPVYVGVTGETKFDEYGDCNTKPFIKQIIRGEKYENL